MNNQDKLDRLLDYLLNGLEKATDFAAEQAPLVVQELITWQRVQTLACAVLCAVGSYVAYRRSVRLSKRLQESLDRHDGNDCAWFLGTILSGIACLGLSIAVTVNLYYAFQVWCAPRVYLLEYVRTLAKK